MDTIALESIARDTYHRHGLDPSEPVSTLRLARLMLGERALVRPPSFASAFPACSFRVGAQTCVAVRRSVPLDSLQWYVGHELAHQLLGRPHGAEAELETQCDYLSAALMAPRDAVQALYRAWGWNVERIASCVVATQTWAGLRLAEVLTQPLAAVGPVVRVRGPEAWAWPDEFTLRRWVRRPPQGVRVLPVSDRPRRALVLPDPH